MRYKSLTGPVKAARRRRALSQAELAARSGVSRVTIARVEGGSLQDFRLGTLRRVCEALGLELAAERRETPGAEGALPALLARERERARRFDRRHRHAALAARLLAMSRPRAAALLRRARERVDLWERDGLCSRHYISRWRAMLTGPRGQVAESLLDPGEWADALFQNTPWSFALEQPAE
jgi:transcriptional regulator with XRE-family HTH domain